MTSENDGKGSGPGPVRRFLRSLAESIVEAWI